MNANRPVAPVAPADLSAAAPGAVGSARYRLAVLYLLVVVMMSGTLPTPLFPLYVQHLGLSAVMVAVVFAIYAAGVLAALTGFGRLSDQIGRRTVTGAALVFTAAGAAVMLALPDVGGLLGGRLLAGVGVGLMGGTATAYLSELTGDRGRAAMSTAVATMGGLGGGALLTGVLAQCVPYPTRVPYVALLILLLPGLSMISAPETVAVERKFVFRPQRLGVPAGMRTTFAGSATAAFAAFALLALFGALTGQFLGNELHIHNRAVTGVVVFLAFATAAFAQLASARLRNQQAGLVIGAVLMPIGALAFVASLYAASIWLFLAGAILGGAGSGLAFRSGLTIVVSRAPLPRLGEVSSSYLAVAYLGLSVPIVGMGILTTEYSAATAAALFTALIVACAVVGPVLGQISRRTAS